MDRVRRFVSVSRLSRWLLFVGEAFIPGSGTAAGKGENNYYCYQTEFGSRHARKFILGTGWRGRHCWRKQASLTMSAVSSMLRQHFPSENSVRPMHLFGHRL